MTRTLNFELFKQPLLTDEQRRICALMMSIDSIVLFEQPRDGTYRRTASSTGEFLARAKEFEEFIKNGSTGATT